MAGHCPGHFFCSSRVPPAKPRIPLDALQHRVHRLLMARNHAAAEETAMPINQPAASAFCRRSHRSRPDRPGDDPARRRLKDTIDRYGVVVYRNARPPSTNSMSHSAACLGRSKSGPMFKIQVRQEAHRQSRARRCRQSRCRRQHHEAGQPPHAVSQGRPAVACRHVVSSQPRDLFAAARPRNSAGRRRRRHAVCRHARRL